MRSIIALAVAGMYTLLVPAAASAGWYAKQTQSMGAPGAPSQESEMYYGHHQLRVDSSDKTSIIINLQTGAFTMIDHSKKQYAQITLEELVKMQDEMLTQMRAQLPKMPPEVRKNIEEQLDAQEKANKAELKIKATGKKDTVAGNKCAVYAWTAPEGEIEACMGDKLKVDVSDFRKDARALAKKLKEKGVGAGAGSMVLLQVADRGFPLRTVRTMKMGPQAITATTEVTSMKKKNVPKTTFNPPKAYSKKDFKTMMMQGPPSKRAQP